MLFYEKNDDNYYFYSDNLAQNLCASIVVNKRRRYDVFELRIKTNDNKFFKLTEVKRSLFVFRFAREIVEGAYELKKSYAWWVENWKDFMYTQYGEFLDEA